MRKTETDRQTDRQRASNKYPAKKNQTETKSDREADRQRQTERGGGGGGGGKTTTKNTYSDR